MVKLKKYIIEHFDNEKSKYLEEDEQSRKEDLWVLSRLGTFPRKAERYELLELGCGGAGLLRTVSLAFPNVRLYGIDITKSMLILAQKRMGVNLLRSDAEKLPFMNGSFSVIVCRNLLHHLVGDSMVASKRNTWRVLSEIKRVLKERGHFIIIEQGISSEALSHLIFICTYVLARLNVSVSKLQIQKRVVVSFLTPEELFGTLKKLHMQVLERWCMRGPGFQKFLPRMFIIVTKVE